MAADYAIRAQGLSRRFGDFVAVDNVSLDIPRAQIYGFLGPNGSGKSTTIRMLCGLLTPSGGSAQVLDTQIPRDAERLRRRIGYMTQHFSLYEDLSVAENLHFMARIQTLPRSTRKRRIETAMERYELSDRARQRAGSLSGGEQQRLALAAATLHRPELLLLDEPTSAVDPQSRRNFWERLFELLDQDTTILVSTHYMDEAERCHRLAILDRGRLVAEGAPQAMKRDIDALVLEVETGQPRRAGQLLLEQDCVKSIAQIGARLHVLVARDLDEPEARLRRILSPADAHVRVALTEATLEDVFVAATGYGRQR